MNFQARTKLYKALLFVVVCVLAIMIAPSARGQATGSFSGNLADKSGGAIPSATVTVTAQETGQVRTTKTDSTGHYLVPLLPVGLFTVKVDAAGFNSAETKDLRLQVDEARELDFTLVPKTVVETVAVEADAVAVETANPSLGQVITSQEVSQLPLNGRDFVQLATLTAGATAETNPGSFFTGASDSEVAARGSFSLSVGGSRPNSTDWLLDGVDNNELTAGGIGVFSSIDDIAGIQGPHLHLLRRIRHARRTHRSGHDEIGDERLPWLSLRVRPQHRPRRKRRLCHQHPEVQSESVWRLRGRTHSPQQSVLLCGRRAEVSARGNYLPRTGSHAGDDQRRLYQRSLGQCRRQHQFPTRIRGRRELPVRADRQQELPYRPAPMDPRRPESLATRFHPT